MNEEWCFDCQNAFDAQQGHHCVHGWRIAKRLEGKGEFFSTKVQKNEDGCQFTFPLTEAENSYPISVINELENKELDVFDQKDFTYLQTNSDIHLLKSSECASEKMNRHFMVRNSLQTCIEDSAKREIHAQGNSLNHDLSKIGLNFPMELNICNNRMPVDICGTNVITSQFSKVEKSSMPISEDNNLDFIMAGMNIDSLMLNKTETSKGHQQSRNVKIDHLFSKNIGALSDKRKLNTDFESNITLSNKEMVSKVVRMSEMSRQFSVSGYTAHDSNQEYELENMPCPIQIKENSIYQQLKSDNMFTMAANKACTLNGSLTSQEKALTFGNQINQGDKKQIAPVEIWNPIMAESKQPCYADANAVISDQELEFRTKNILKQHYQIHSEGKTFTCRFCQEKFTTKGSLNRHEREAHTAKATYKCEICGKILSSKIYLEKHIQIHMGHKQLKCDYCGKLFGRKYGMDIHIRTHTGEKPYKCDICIYAFTNKYRLNQHIKKWHQGT